MRFFAIIALALGLPAATLAGPYDVSSVDFPGAANTALYAINNRAQFVGAEKDTSGAHHAIFNDGSQLTRLDPTGPVGNAKESWAYSINNHADIAGAYRDAAGAFHGYVRRRGGAIEVFDHPGGFDTQAYGINDHGSVIGVYSDAAGNSHAFVWRHGQYRSADLPGALQTVPLSINNDEEIAGEYLVSADTLGYGYVQQSNGRYTLSTAPGSAPQQTYFISINNRRQLLGAYADAAGNSHNFIRQGASYLPFELPARFGTGYVSAQTINDAGDIVGYYLDAGSVAHGFVAKAVRPGPDD